MRSWVGVGPGSMSRTVRSEPVTELASERAFFEGDEEFARAEGVDDGVPVQLGLRQQQDGVGRQSLHELPGRLEQRDGLRPQRHRKRRNL